MNTLAPLRVVPIGAGSPTSKVGSDAKTSPALLYACHPLQLLPELAEEIGVKEALFLQQLFYWSEWKRARGLDTIDDRTWVWNSAAQWCNDMPFLTCRTAGRISRKLVRMKLIDALQLNKSQGDMTFWYALNKSGIERLRNRLESKAAQRKEEREKRRRGMRGRPSTIAPHWRDG